MKITKIKKLPYVSFMVKHTKFAIHMPFEW